MIKRTFVISAALLASTSCLAEMQAMDDTGLADVTGQGGVYLSGEFAINKMVALSGTTAPALTTSEMRKET